MQMRVRLRLRVWVENPKRRVCVKVCAFCSHGLGGMAWGLGWELGLDEAPDSKSVVLPSCPVISIAHSRRQSRIFFIFLLSGCCCFWCLVAGGLTTAALCLSSPPQLHSSNTAATAIRFALAETKVWLTLTNLNSFDFYGLTEWAADLQWDSRKSSGLLMGCLSILYALLGL